MSGWASHKVSDSKPVLRSKDVGFPYSAMSNPPGLNAAYETMDRAKTALRRAERHIAHAEKRSVHDINPFVPADFTVPVDRVPSYSIPAETSDPTGSAQIKLDKFGRSSYLRARDSVSRKVSRMEEKYNEDFDAIVGRNKSPLREANVNINQLDGYANFGSRQTLSSSKNIEGSLSESKASREMERRILNNRSDQELDMRFERSYPYPGKKVGLTHVDVMVPGNPQTRTRQSTGEPTWQSSTYPGAANSVISSNSTFTVSGKSSSSSQKAKLNLNSEKLEKLRDKIRQQRLNALKEPPPQLQNNVPHSEEDPVVPRNYTEYNPASQPPVPLVRKVASGPPVPRYKGFSEAQTNWEEQDLEKISRASHSRKKASVPSHPQNTHSSAPAVDDSRQEKQHRVVAQMKYPQRAEKQKDVITTKSWRSGAKVVNKVLGPNKLPRMSDSPPTKDKTRSRISEEHEIQQEDNISMEDQLLVNQAAKMSDEAKAILADMQLVDHRESDESHEEGEPSKKRSAKRQRQKTIEQDQDIKAAKVRHYDSDEVRKFIAKQKMQRKRQIQTEAEVRKKAEEKKQLQLQELYEKQRAAARSRSSSARRSQSLSREDLREQRHKNSGSDKENHHGMDTSSSDTSTLTGENTSVADENPRSDHTKLPDQSMDDVDVLVQKYSKKAQSVSFKDTSEERKSLPGTQDSGFAMTADEIIAKYLNGQTTENIINQYAQQADAIKQNFNTKEGHVQERGRSSGQRMATTIPHNKRNGVGSLGQSAPVPSNRPLAAATAGGRSRIDRLESIKQTAQFLQSRLNVETKRLATEIDRVPVPGENQKWVTVDNSDNSEDSDKFATRYDKLTGGEEDGAIFDRDLPGVGSLAEVARDREKRQNTASSNVQPVLRQYGKPSALEEFSDVDSNLSDSTSEDIRGRGRIKEAWVHDRKSAKTLVPATKSSHIDQPAPTIDTHRYKPYNRSQPPNIPSSVTTRTSHGYNLDKPEADPYSVLNIYARRSQKQKQRKQPVSSNGVTQNDPSRRTSAENLGNSQRGSEADYDSLDEQSLHSSILSEHQYSDDFSEEISKSAGISRKSVESASKGKSPSRTSDIDTFGSPPRSNRKPSSHKSSFKDNQNRAAGSDEERTLEELGSDNSLNDTLTPISDQSQEQDLSVQTNTSGSGKSDVGQKSEQKSLVLSSKNVSKRRPNGSDTTVSSMAEESSYRRSKDPQFPRVHDIHVSSRVDARFSPNTLERRMAAELNLLEGVDESINQLTSVERIRAVGLAQQETVSLAQIIKARQLNHQQELEANKLKHREDALESSRQVEDARRRAAEATQEAASAIWAARNETTSSIQESTQKLIATQAEAARATADAARQFAEVSKTATQQNRTLYDVGSIAKESATAAASAAVSAAMASYPYSKYLGLPKVDRSAQYSLKSQGSTDYSRSSAPYSSTFENSNSNSASRTSSVSPAVKNGISSKRDLSESVGSDVMTAADLSNMTADKQSSSRSTTVKTASDSSANKNGSSIQEESAAGAGQSSPSKSESMAEDLPSDKDDYSIEFDTSVTEEELEKSLREVVPTESLRKNLKRRNSISDISSADDSQLHTSMGSAASRRMSFENDSFTHFTVEMVRQYMREEEIRAQHQNALLKLREKALREKTKAELAWLEQQKHHMRDKGADDVYPQLKKRRRGLLLRLQQEQTEIKRLKEASKAAAKDRQLLLRHSQEIAKLQQSTQQVLRRMKDHQFRASKWLLGGGAPPQNLDRNVEYDANKDLDLYLNFSQDPDSRGSSPASSIPFDSSESSDQVREKIKRSVPGEDGKSGALEDVSVPMDDGSVDEATKTTPRKGTDTDVSINQSHMSSPSAEIVQKLKMKLDQKYLTVREQKLQQRRQQVEELLAWKEKLDEEEAMIRRMEKEALQTFQRTQKSKLKATPPSISTSKSKVSTGEKEVSFAEPSLRKKDDLYSDKEEPAHQTPRTPRADTIAEETLASQVASDAGSISEDISVSMTSGSTTGKPKSTARSSIQESIRSGSSATKDITTEISATQSKKRTRDSEVETPTTSIQDYTNDAFETEGSHTAEVVTESKKASGSPSKEIATISNGKVITRPPKSPHRRNSESESEDSFSMPYSVENTSDQSDVEGRIRALNEELKRKKAEAEQIKREEKKKHKQRLKEQETSLKKQIEVYEKYIDQVKGDVPTDGQENKQTQNLPKIKQPSESRHLGKSAEPVSPGKAVPISTIELSVVDDSNASLQESLSGEVSVKHKISSSTPSKPVSLKESSVELDLTPVHSVHTSKSSITQRTQATEPSSPEKSRVPSEISVDDDEIKEDSILDPSTEKSSEALLDFNKDKESKVESESRIQTESRESESRVQTESKPESRTQTESKPESQSRTQTESKPESESRIRTESDSIIETESHIDSESAKVSDVTKESKDDKVGDSIAKGDKDNELLSQKSQLSQKESEKEDLQSVLKDDRTERTETVTEDKSLAFESDLDKSDVTSEVSEHEPSLSQHSEASFHYSSSQKSYTDSTHSQSSQSEASQSGNSQHAKSDSVPNSVADSVHTDVEQEISEHVSVNRTEFSDSPQLKLDLAHLKDDESEDEKKVEEKKEEEVAKEIDDIVDTPRMTEDLDLEKIGEEMDDPLSQFSVGDRVLVGGSEAGTLRFKGRTSFAEGLWGGVELDRAQGTCDGTQQGVRYFTCEDNHGIFAPSDKLQQLSVEDEQKSQQEEESLPDLKQEQFPETDDSIRDAESSVAEDVSISSELERAISSAAAAVEEFGSFPGQEEIPEPKEEEAEEKEIEKEISEKEVEKEISEHDKETVKKQALETLVDSVTDSIFAKVAKARVDGNGAGTNGLDVATRNLLNDSISQMMDIYQRRKSSSASEEEPEIIDTGSPVISELKESEESLEKESKATTSDDEDGDLDPWSGDLGEKVKVAQDDDFLRKVPSSFPEFSAGLSAEKDDLAMMYHELEALTGEEWMDDDFGLGIQPKDPPPYPENRGRPDIAAALANLAKEPLYFIPHKKEEIENAVQSCVNLFWERRRYGEPWDDFTAPPELFESSETTEGMEAKSKHAFKNFLFDLTGDILRDTYREEEADSDDDFVWQKTRRLVKRKFFRGGSPPLTVDEVRPIVEQNVLNLLGHTETTSHKSKYSKWSSRKKRDHVDRVLLKELREEEPDWVNYAEDELTVKYQIADSIFESLLSETGQVMMDIMDSKRDSH